MRHPADETRIRGERDDGVALDVEVSFEGLRICHEQSVDQSKELHHALILPDVLVALEQELVILAIAAFDRELPRSLL